MGQQYNDDLERLVQRCRTGDSDAWALLIARFRAMVYAIPRRYGLGADDAADVFLTTFQSLYRNLDRIDSAHGLPKWLSLTASREAVRVKRIASRASSTDDLGISLDEMLAADEATAELEALQAEETETLRSAITQLDLRCRELLSQLYMQDDSSYTEIAEKMKMPIGSIGPTRARCLNKLRLVLERKGFFE